MVVFVQKLFYSGKSSWIHENGCIRAKDVVFGKKWLYSDRSGSIRKKVVVFGQKLLYSNISGFNSRWSGFNLPNWFYSDKSVCIGTKVFYSC